MTVVRSKYYGTNAAGTRGYHDLLPTVTSLAPIGTTQGTAAAITSDWTEIINFTVGVNEGVILPEPVPGKVYRIFTSDIGTGNSLKIYPPIGKAFNNDPANQPAEIGSHTAFTIYAINTTGYRT